MFTDEVFSWIDRSVLCWLATVNADGMPNVSPKETFAAHGSDTLLIANIASPNSVRNILANARVCVSFVDVFAQKGCKLKGTARVVRPSDPEYREFEPPLIALTKGAFPIRSIIAVKVFAVEPILAPSYRLIPGTTEASQIEAAMRTYGVTPRS